MAPRDIGRKSVFWLAEEVADYLQQQCVVTPNPQHARALADIWSYILDPFFAGSPAGDSSHGAFLENYTPSSSVIATLGPNDAFSVQIDNIPRAIAYVLSTSLQSFPPRKYLILAAVFSHFCRVAHTSQRPKAVHFLWPTELDGTLARNPIILLDDALVMKSSEGRRKADFRVMTLREITSSLLVPDHEHVSTTCDCSKLIPAVWLLSHTGSVLGFSFDFNSLLSLARRYRKGEIRSPSLAASARPMCDACTHLLVSDNLLHVAYTDLGNDAYANELSSGSSDDHHHDATVAPGQAQIEDESGSSPSQQQQQQRPGRRRRSSSAVSFALPPQVFGEEDDGGEGQLVRYDASSASHSRSRSSSGSDFRQVRFSPPDSQQQPADLHGSTPPPQHQHQQSHHHAPQQQRARYETRSASAKGATIKGVTYPIAPPSDSHSPPSGYDYDYDYDYEGRGHYGSTRYRRDSNSPVNGGAASSRPTFQTTYPAAQSTLLSGGGYSPDQPQLHYHMHQAQMMHDKAHAEMHLMAMRHQSQSQSQSQSHPHHHQRTASSSSIPSTYAYQAYPVAAPATAAGAVASYGYAPMPVMGVGMGMQVGMQMQPYSTTPPPPYYAAAPASGALYGYSMGVEADQHGAMMLAGAGQGAVHPPMPMTFPIGQKMRRSTMSGLPISSH